VQSKQIVCQSIITFPFLQKNYSGKDFAFQDAGSFNPGTGRESFENRILQIILASQNGINYDLK